MKYNFKSFKTRKFENVKICGMYEQLKPIELIVNVSFSLTPSNPLILTENSITKFIEQFSPSSIDKEIRKKLIYNDWKYDGCRYTYEHDVNCFVSKFFNKFKIKNDISSLGIDLYFIQTSEIRSIKEFYELLIPKIARLNSFQNSNYFVIRPNRK